jgi:hypothetical protein
MKTKSPKLKKRPYHPTEQTRQARINTAREMAALSEQKVNDLIFPCFVYRMICKELR